MAGFLLAPELIHDFLPPPLEAAVFKDVPQLSPPYDIPELDFHLDFKITKTIPARNLQ